MISKDHVDPELRGAMEFVTARLGHDFMATGTAATRRQRFNDFLCEGGETAVQFPHVARETRSLPASAVSPQIEVTIYTPPQCRPPAAAILYYHGGGFTVGSVAQEDANAAALADTLGSLVISTEYRLAPETRHPGPIEDCYAAACWAWDHAASLQLDRTRLAVYGHSAGGGIAANVALMARDRNGPAIAYQMLCYPMLDDRCDSVSMTALDGIGLFDAAASRKGWEALLRGTEGGGSCPAIDILPYAAAARAETLAGLPAAYIDVGAVDVLRDENIDFAARLMHAAVATELHVYPRAYHGFDMFAPDAAVSRQAVATRMTALRRALQLPQEADGDASAMAAGKVGSATPTPPEHE